MSSSSLARDLPPVTYLANKIASQLLQSGEGTQMFDRRCDADCVLNVGQRRYYVHVQMLASRSPTLRRIFDDMIENKAWGNLIDRSSSQGLSQAGDEMDYSFEGSVQEDEDQEDRHHSPSVSPHERSILCSVDQFGPSLQYSLQLSVDLPPESSTEDYDEGGRDPDMYDDYGEVSNPDSDEDRCLPELVINLADPEASHFEELLYYNIAYLNMLTKHVLDICLAFEQATPPEMQLCGLALQLLHKSSLIGPGRLGISQDVDGQEQ
ncbi:hypothetical protein BGZ93_006237 [Podila epicladia]|nr:hypothetical protein BGZ93_006237 [Podila epicladia]